nr:MAG TPA: hypothetical protein [Caudoviricetes sp.]
MQAYNTLKRVVKPVIIISLYISVYIYKHILQANIYYKLVTVLQ